MKLQKNKSFEHALEMLRFLKESKAVISSGGEIDQTMLHKRATVQEQLFGTRKRLQTNPKFYYYHEKRSN